MPEKPNRLFIPHARLNEYQLAGWNPSCVAESGLGCQLMADVMIPMPDGIKLSADVYLPAKAGKYPVILQFSAYNRDLHTTGLPTGNNEIGSPPVITDRGYVQVVVTARSIGRSEGSFQPWQNEQETDDHYHCIDWASKQSWSNGDVCLFGTSYYGMNQASVAVRNPPALKAFFANEICTDFYRHVFHYGGISNVDFMSLWVGANFNPSTVHRYVAPWKRALLSYIINRPWLWKRLKPYLPRIVKKLKNKEATPEALRWYLHVLFDSNRREDTQIASGPFKHLHKINVPFVVVQNLGDISLHQYGCYDLFEHASTAPDKKWLIIGPAEYELPVYSWQLEALAFFDHILKGVNNGYSQLARVRYWVEGKNSFDSAPDFPVPDTTTRKYYLKGKPSDLDTHILQNEIPETGQNSWLSIPHGVEILPNIDILETQKLAYELLIEKTTTLVGPITVQLQFSCNEIDSYLITRLGRLDEEGRYHLLSMGHLRPATRTVDSEKGSKCEIAINTSEVTPLKHNQPVILYFSMTPTASLLKEGDRLLFEISSRTDQFKTGLKDGFIIPSMAVPPYFCRNRIHYGEQSYIKLPFKI